MGDPGYGQIELNIRRLRVRACYTTFEDPVLLNEARYDPPDYRVHPSPPAVMPAVRAPGVSRRSKGAIGMSKV